MKLGAEDESAMNDGGKFVQLPSATLTGERWTLKHPVDRNVGENPEEEGLAQSRLAS